MCGIRRREMKMVLVLLWAAGAIVLGIGVFELFLTGSLGEILKKEETRPCWPRCWPYFYGTFCGFPE